MRGTRILFCMLLSLMVIQEQQGMMRLFTPAAFAARRVFFNRAEWRRSPWGLMIQRISKAGVCREKIEAFRRSVAYKGIVRDALMLAVILGDFEWFNASLVTDPEVFQGMHLVLERLVQVCDDAESRKDLQGRLMEEVFSLEELKRFIFYSEQEGREED